jgi:hypothetical protein
VVLHHIVSELFPWTSTVVNGLTMDGLDPTPSAPPGMDRVAGTVISWVKWIAITCVFALGFTGILAMAAGRVTGNVDWSKYGQRGLLLGGFLAALFGVIYQVYGSLSTTPGP